MLFIIITIIKTIIFYLDFGQAHAIAGEGRGFKIASPSAYSVLHIDITSDYDIVYFKISLFASSLDISMTYCICRNGYFFSSRLNILIFFPKLSLKYSCYILSNSSSLFLYIYVYIYSKTRLRIIRWNKVERPVQRMKKNKRDSTQEKERHGMTGLSQPSYSTV